MNHIAMNAAIERERVAQCAQAIPRWHREMVSHLRGYVERNLPGPTIEQYIELLLPILELARKHGPLYVKAHLGHCINSIRISDELRAEEDEIENPDDPRADEERCLRRDYADMDARR